MHAAGPFSLAMDEIGETSLWTLVVKCSAGLLAKFSGPCHFGSCVRAALAD